MSLPRGYNEAGAEWLEPWCDEHPDLDGEGCVACIGASHDAWMHRAKAAEAEVARLREALSSLYAYCNHLGIGNPVMRAAREALGGW